MNIYTNSSTRIACNRICSALNVVKNGVKQGGVMSPILFCILLDGLLNLLAAAHIGCFIARVNVGCLAYADDIVLFAPPLALCAICLQSVTCLQKNLT